MNPPLDKISWTTKEYFHQEKTADWYWVVGIVTISIALISIILNNVIFAILVIVSSFTLSLFASRKPEDIKITVDQKGVTVGKTQYPYINLDSFWIETREIQPKIILKSKKMLMFFIVIFIEEVEIEEVKELLNRHLPEEEHQEPFLEKLLVYLGF